MQYIIICNNKDKYLSNSIDKPNIKLFSLYKQGNNEISFFKRLFRKFIYFTGLELNGVFYSHWYKYLKEENIQFIIFDDIKPFFRIKKIFKKAKKSVIFYLWNPIQLEFTSKKINKLKKFYNVFTYSKFDSQKFHLKYNCQFLSNVYHISFNNIGEEKYDCIFCGLDKQRTKRIEQIYLCCKHPYFYLLKDERYSVHSAIITYKNSWLSYRDYILKLNQSQCVLDVCPCENSGMTLRVLEAVYYNKKLITDNKDVKNEPFYNEEKVLIFDDNTPQNRIIQFLNKKTDSNYNINFEDLYSFNARIKRFENE